MAEKVVFSELLCFLKSHFGNTPLAGILSVIASYYNDDEISKAKVVLHELCCKNLEEDLVPRLITRKGDNKRKLDSEDIGKLLTILDENKVGLPQFAALNLRRVPQIDPSNVDLCFLLESVEELRKSVNCLLDVRKDIDALKSAVSTLSRPSSNRLNDSHPRQDCPPVPKSAQQPSLVASTSKSESSYAQSLRVNLPPLSESHQRQFNDNRRAKPQPIVGTKKVEASAQCKLKVSSEPRAFHLYVGNLDTSSEPSDVFDYLKEGGVKVLNCEMVHSSRPSDDYPPRASSAHVVIDVLDKEKALSPSSWETGIIVRPWRFPRKNWFHNDNNRW